MKNERIQIQKPYKDRRVQNSLFSFRRFIGVFLGAAIIISCSLYLFFGTDSLKEIFISENLSKEKALINIANLALLCLCFSVIDGIRKRITIGRPVLKILDATHKVTSGDFSTKIEPINSVWGRDEFDAIIEDFNKMTAELSSIETLKTDFIANVSHELKTPIAVIQNYATILQDPTLSEEKRNEYCRNLLEASKNLSDLTSSILKLNKLENQTIYPSMSKFNLADQLCQSLLSFENEWEKKNIDIITDLDETIEINGDNELLWIVWSNLFSNATKFNKENGVISVTLRKQGTSAIVTIRDTGCGMTEEVRNHIFEKFYQADASRVTKGNGLGLTIVKKIIDILGGEISVESEPEKYSLFTVTLPLE